MNGRGADCAANPSAGPVVTGEAATAALFDLDGVILDTEPQYTVFWKDICARYLGDGSLSLAIKGQTLDRIYRKFFDGQTELQREITAKLDEFEANMDMPYIPGVIPFVQELHAHGVRTAVVTSSNKPKMESVYRRHAELPSLFDHILTAERFTRSKPDPEPYLLGAADCGVPPERCFVFEDSFNGIAAGNAAHMAVIGLATTNPAEQIKAQCRLVVKDFTELDYSRMMRA